MAVLGGQSFGSAWCGEGGKRVDVRTKSSSAYEARDFVVPPVATDFSRARDHRECPRLSGAGGPPLAPHRVTEALESEGLPET